MLSSPSVTSSTPPSRGAASNESACKTSCFCFSAVKNIDIHMNVSVSELENSGLYQRIQGPDRLFFINNRTGDGYKLLFKKDTDKSDDTLSDLYKNENFYNGRYKNLVINKPVKIPAEPSSNNMVKAAYFQMIPSSEKLTSLPAPIAAIAEGNLNKAGYFLGDLKSYNFIRANNGFGGWDYLPIDGRTLCKLDSNSRRTEKSREVLIVQNIEQYRLPFSY